MKTVSTNSICNAEGSAGTAWQGGINVTLTEEIGQTTTEFKASMSNEKAHDLYKRLRNSLIEAKVIRGKKTY